MITLLATPGSLMAGASVEVEREEAHHLKVRRARTGDPIRLVDGQGQVGEGVLAENASVVLGQVETVARPTTLILAVGAGDRDRFGWLVEKSAELGVTDLIPLETERTAGVSSRIRPQHLERLQRRGIEAIKQCGSAWAPIIHQPKPVVEFLAGSHTGVLWLGSATGAVPGAIPGAESASILIGPEGGLTDTEHRLAVAAGFTPVRFGQHLLRFETAALAAAAQVQLLREVSQ